METILCQTVSTLFNNQVEARPDQIAVVSQGVELTYKELNLRSEQLAKYLLHYYQLKVGSIVAIMLDRSVDMVVAILGILKAGGAYLPLEPNHPFERNKKIVNESNPTVVITNQKTLSENEYISNFIDVSKLLSLEDVLLNPLPSNFLSIDYLSLQPNDLAYVIYTSGSTGEPKGVMIEHKSIVNLVEGLHESILKSYGSSLNIALVASYIFDASVQQIFSAILLGHTLFITPYDTKQDAKKLIRFYNKHKIDISDGTPALLRMLSKVSSDIHQDVFIRHFIIGGEVLETQTLNAFLKKFQNSSKITNIYGVTECCVDSLSYLVDPIEVNKLGFVPIGTALLNTNIYILDGKFCPVEIGQVGQLYIGGLGVGRGYIARSELTAKKFIRNPFNSQEVLYETGDLAQWIEGEKIKFLGRVDRQVKLRGYRIELGEIETALLQYSKPSPKKIKNYTPISELENSLIQRCQYCLLDSRHPNIVIEDNLCNVCRTYQSYRQDIEDYFKSIDDFQLLMEAAQTNKQSNYDCLLLYSGGKDSTYALFRLVEMGYKVLTFTFDNGFISDTALRNIERITSNLGIKHITSKASNMNDVFVESLKVESTVCNGCFRALTYISTKLAKEEGINVIITGLSRGQIFETKLRRLFESGMYALDGIEDQLLLHRKLYHSRNDRISKLLDVAVDEASLDTIHFIDYFRFDSVTTPGIKQYLIRRDESWRSPKDTGLCSTNCKINNVGIFVHQKERGFHNYAAPLSWDVRLGVLTREEGLREIEDVIHVEDVHEVLNEIGYNLQDRDLITVQEAAVVLKQRGSREPFLCSYIVSDADIGLEDLRNYLLQKLPEYMVPSEIIKMESFPLTVSGKIDLAELALLDSCPESTVLCTASPLNETEERLLRLWQEVLERQDIGIDDDFFAIGGDSISATILTMLIEEEFDAELSVTEAFNSPSIRSLAGLIIRNNLTRNSNKEKHGFVLFRQGTDSSKHFFLMHDVFGRVEAYLSLSHTLDSRFNIWGIPTAILDVTSQVNPSLRDLCRVYVNGIKEVQPEGFYYLGGWSFGGSVAFEVALQLEELHNEVSLLSIFDANAPEQSFWKNLYITYLNSFNQLIVGEHVESKVIQEKPIDLTKYQLQHIANLLFDSRTQLELMSTQLSLEAATLLAGNLKLSKDKFALYFENLMLHLKVMSNYAPKRRIESSIAYFKCHDSRMVSIDDWYNYTKSNCNILRKLHGDHFSILEPPLVMDTAIELNQLFIKLK